MRKTGAAPVAHTHTMLAAASVWILAGLLFPLLGPLTQLLLPPLQRFLVSAAAMSDELAFYVAFTIFRIPLTAVLGVLLAAAQCALVPALRPLSRPWVIAAGIGACISTLIWLPSSLVVIQNVGDTFATRVVLLIYGAGLLGGLVSVFQSKAVRKRMLVPGWFVAASFVATILGAVIPTFLF
jgi:hypothetical protein